MTGRRPARWRITNLFSHLFVLVVLLNRIVPRGAKRWLAGRITRVCFLLLRRTRGVIMANLGPLFPDAAPRELRAKARRLVIGYGDYFVDLFAALFARRVPPASDYFSEWTGGEALHEAVGAGRGVLLVTPHLGNWEMGLLVLREQGLPLAVLTAPIASPYMRRRMEDVRRRLGVEVVTLERPEEYLFRLKALLEARKVVVLLADRHEGGASAVTPFFGRPARLPTGYLHLARLFDAPVLPCFILRAPDGRYRCVAESPIRVDAAADRDEAVRRALAEVVTVFERYLRAYPLQWYRFTPVWE